MKKLLLPTLIISLIFLSGCSNGDTWQGAYYDGGTNDSDIIYGPIFSDYEGCKDWATSMTQYAYNNYSYCSKNCHDSVAGTPICEEVVRSRAPFERSMTFDNYQD